MDKKRRAALRLRPPEPEGFTHVVGAEVTAEELGGLLCALRTALGVKQGELAEASGILYQNLSRLEHGRREVSIDTMNRYLRGLGFELLLVARPLARRAK